MDRTQFSALLVVAALCTPALAAGDPADKYPGLHLIPWPKTLKPGEGHLTLTAASRIVVGEEQLRPLAKVLAEEIATLTGLNLETTAGAARAGDIVLKINPAIKADEPILVLRNREPVRTTDGAHTLAITDQAVVEGFDYRAVAEGSSTLLQLLGKTENTFRLARVTIKDWPHADFCGAMLDVARQDHAIDDIKKVVQLCRLYKARYLQLHLTDDQGWTFPSTRFPKLGTKNHAAHGGRTPRLYKLEELKELVAYADARGVTLVPELEMPGHSGAALRSAPEIFDAIDPVSKQPVGMGCMNMSNEEIYSALDVIIGEMCDVFRSSPYFHIGSDEVFGGRVSLHPGYKAFLAKHGLKDDHQLADYFVASVCDIVKKHGKKAIKWEGMANAATRDVIIMAWDANSTVAGEMIARGYTTITCPWNLGVPWEQWNMYVCNGSRLKKGDSVLGSTLVAWEQSPLTHITSLRKLAERQERTWGPDTSVTVDGFASRFQPLDAIAGRLIGLPPKPRLEASFSTSSGTVDFLDPVFAFDGNEATFYQSARPPRARDHFTLTFPQLRQVYALEVLTGVNGKCQLNRGELQVSADGENFTTAAVIDKGRASAILKDNGVRAVRIRATADQTEPLVVREINVRLMVDVSGIVRNPGAVIGSGNVAVTSGDTEFAYPIGAVTAPIINRGNTLRLNNGGNAFSIGGPISGTGIIEVFAAGPNAPLILDGKDANSMTGAWAVKAGRVVLAKPPGVDAILGMILVGGTAGSEAIVLGADDQIRDDATLELLGARAGGASLHLNGHREKFTRLTLATGTKVYTDGAQGSGVLSVRELMVAGKSLPRGIYAAGSGWLEGSGYVIVGDVKQIDVKGTVEDPNGAVGAGNLAVLKAAATFRLPAGDCNVSALTGGFPLTLSGAGDKVRFGGFITGSGGLRVETMPGQSIELTGPSSNSFKGATTLIQGELRLNKPPKSIAIPGDFMVGESTPRGSGAIVALDADGQIAPTAAVTLAGLQSCILDLNSHTAAFAKLMLSKAAVVRTGKEGSLRLRQLFVDGKRMPDGVYRVPQPWLEGSGAVTVDARVDVKGAIGSPETAIGVGNIGNLTGNMKIGYPSGGGDFDIITNGFTVALDSGDGNAFAYSGSISGTGNVEFYMGPSHTGFRDAPMRITGPKPNTTTGKFLVKKGRVQLEKPEGVDAISGDVVVGGQGFNDCLFWKNSHQVKDSATITLLDSGNSGAAYLHLNGCSESVAGLTLTVRNRVVTDSEDGKSGVLTLKTLAIGGIAQPAGVYAAGNARWIEGKGKVIVRP